MEGKERKGKGGEEKSDLKRMSWEVDTLGGRRLIYPEREERQRANELHTRSTDRTMF